LSETTKSTVKGVMFQMDSANFDKMELAITALKVTKRVFIETAIAKYIESADLKGIQNLSPVTERPRTGRPKGSLSTPKTLKEGEQAIPHKIGSLNLPKIDPNKKSRSQKRLERQEAFLKQIQSLSIKGGPL